ncbi:MAG: trypsin-like peptidase domain-containing protein, partial [Deltaproteobacteria bacterium]|nr:trypsin-like peptidase domain-containing protein [Deltaproteobacteria bacterium]
MWHGILLRPGYVATNAHVVSLAKACPGSVKLINNKGLILKGEIVKINTAGTYGEDLAIIKVDDKTTPSLTFGDSGEYK